MKKIKHIKFSEKDLLELERSREDEKWLNSVPITTLKKHAGEYIAVKNKKIIAHSASLKDVYQKIDELGVNRTLISKIEEEGLVVY
ncbi:MAG: hypothetical protein CVT88_08285 [Candidatus Altiarchaeales archaeon HGW-Altiarchaeales-1]|nr:MAG: hypothetical protein CVT88_08285 [Candidatus Altiarchaeales archaeon HGW-Altiarchaeales-1]